MVNDDMETLLNILLELSSPHNVPDIFKQYDTTNLNISERIGNPKPYCEFNDRSLAHPPGRNTCTGTKGLKNSDLAGNYLTNKCAVNENNRCVVNQHYNGRGVYLTARGNLNSVSSSASSSTSSRTSNANNNTSKYYYNTHI